MLLIVREIYPQAWAGEAPGKKLRANNPSLPQGTAPAPVAPRAAASAPAPIPAAAAPRAAAPAIPNPAPVASAAVIAAPAPAAAVPAPASAAAPAEAAPVTPHPFASMPAPTLTADFEPEPFLLIDDEPQFKPLDAQRVDVPVIHPPVTRPVVSPPPAAAAPVAAKPAPAKPVAKAAAPKAAPPKPAAAKPAAAKFAAPAPKPAAPSPVAAKPAATVVVPKVTAPAKPPVVAPKIAAKVTAPALTAAAPIAKAATPPVQATAPVAAKAPPPEPTVQMPVMPAAPSLANMRQVIEELDDLSDTQTIRLLERHSPYREGSQEASVDEAIRVIKPEDAQSMLAIKSEVKRNAPVLFAVQLDWSVTPFDMAKVAPLAIFNAYTLYTTEANREGRTWYGLRLGFFSDAVSAKQVAYYVRSDFKTVSVVPVTTIEKERANDLNAARSGLHRAANIKEGPAPTPASMTQSNASGVFKLLDDDLPAMIEQDVDGETSPRFGKQANTPAPAAAKAATATPEPKKHAPASKARKPGARGTKRDAHAQVDEETLDQTLEILGASTLEIQNDRTGDTGVRHLRVKVDKKGSKFASLIERLSGGKKEPFR
jgi:hypothetical protein